MPPKSRFAEADFLCMEGLYADGWSTRQIGKHFGVHGGSVYDFLQRRGVALRNPSESRRLYHAREDAFRQVIDEPTAYWLGFLFADGNISRACGKNQLRLWLNEQDEAHVQSFLEFLGADYPTRRNTQRHAVGVDIASVRLCDDLTRLGCTERKSLVLRFPVVRADLARHFIRGHFDGDGSAYFTGGAPSVSFVGNREFLENAKVVI